MHSKQFTVTPPAPTSFIFMAESNAIVLYTLFSLSVPLLIGHLDWFCNLVIMNSDVTRPHTGKPLGCADLKSFWSTPRSDIAGSHSRPGFSLLRPVYTDFYGGWTSLRSHQRCIRVPFCPHSYTVTRLHCCFLAVTQSGVRWNLNVVFICFSPVGTGIGYFSVSYHNLKGYGLSW